MKKHSPTDDRTMCFMHVLIDPDNANKYYPTYDADDVSADKLWLDNMTDCENVRRIDTGDYSVLRNVTDTGMIVIFGTESACYEYCEVLNRS